MLNTYLILYENHFSTFVFFEKRRANNDFAKKHSCQDENSSRQDLYSRNEAENIAERRRKFVDDSYRIQHFKNVKGPVGLLFTRKENRWTENDPIKLSTKQCFHKQFSTRSLEMYLVGNITKHHFPHICT